jgi:hypothetical protein
MTLKAAYFAAVGFAESRPITFADLNSARDAGINVYHVTWPNPGKLHNVRAWTELLVEFRSRPPGVPYADPNFGGEIKVMGCRIEPLWNETLRYHKNIAYRHEVERVREAAGWLLDHALVL